VILRRRGQGFTCNDALSTQTRRVAFRGVTCKVTAARTGKFDEIAPAGVAARFAGPDRRYRANRIRPLGSDFATGAQESSSRSRKFNTIKVSGAFPAGGPRAGASQMIPIGTGVPDSLSE